MPISQLEAHFGIFIKKNEYFTYNEAKPIRKNIAYNLQYIEFLNQIIIDIKLTEVLWTQNVKSFVIYGASVVEAIFNFLILSSNQGKKINYKTISSFESNEYILDSKKYKNDITILEKVDIPINTQMTFDQMAKKVESKKLLGENFTNYSRIKPLRQLRNKIHIHDADHSDDTDYYNFNYSEFTLIKEVLYSLVTADIFKASPYYSKFEYLNS